MRRIDAPRAWAFANDGHWPAWADLRQAKPSPRKVNEVWRPVRIIWESDWRKIMAVVKVAEEMCRLHLSTSCISVDLRTALDALNKKEAR